MNESCSQQAVNSLRPILAEDTNQSRELFQRAKCALAGGISSSARATTAGRISYPLYFTSGRGARVWDADGTEFIDYLLGYGSAILGHSSPTIKNAVTIHLECGTMFGTCNPVEVELAEQICRMVPCAELVRFSNSGSEAVCAAVRAARGYTGRSLVLKFEGHYHGWIDVLAVSNRPGVDECGPLEHPRSCPHSRGIPKGLTDDVIVCPFNHPKILTDILDCYDGKVACIIAEPIVANNACIRPIPGFLEHLRTECDRRNIVLIFDEIVTGFRVAPGGAQELFSVIPDLAVFSKGLGGGFPISAMAGRRKIMDLVAANAVKHGGTYNGNPLCAAAALATIRHIAEPQTIAKIRQSGEAIASAAQKAAEKFRIPCAVQGEGGMFQIVFNVEGRPMTHYRDLFRVNAPRQAAFWQSLLDQRILCNSSSSACWFTSAAHTAEDVEITTRAIHYAMKSIA